MPWKRIAWPDELGATTAPDRVGAASYLFVDFLHRVSARQFAAALGAMPGAPLVLERESVRVAAERFRPQQTKRFGPGLLAAEILLPASEVKAFLPRAERLARGAGSELDAEVYYIADGEALVIGGYLTDHRSAAFAVDLVIAPALVDLAMQGHRGRAYVLGRWQAAWFRRDPRITWLDVVADGDTFNGLAAQISSSSPALLGFYKRFFRRQGSFPIYERTL
jgi:hypothetical protein